MRNRKAGRPLLGEFKHRRYQVMMAPDVAARIKQWGGGNMSAGIRYMFSATVLYDVDKALASDSSGRTSRSDVPDVSGVAFQSREQRISKQGVQARKAKRAKK